MIVEDALDIYNAGPDIVVKDRYMNECLSGVFSFHAKRCSKKPF